MGTGSTGNFMNVSRKLRMGVLLLLLLGTVGCDQAAKQLARVRLGDGTIVRLPAGLGELRLAENPGAFLSLGATLPDWMRVWVFTIGVGVGLGALFLYLVCRREMNWLVFLGLALVLGGGISNLIDRVWQAGLVTDYVLLRLGPLHTGVFNLADTLVLIGVGALAWEHWRQRQPAAPAVE